MKRIKSAATAITLAALTLQPSIAQAEIPSRANAAPAPDWQPRGATQIALWPDGLAIDRPETNEPEKATFGAKPIAGKPWTFVTNISRPTMTIFRPKSQTSDAAIMVFPGGGYYGVAIDLEGTEICDWVNALGMTCILLKYRSPQDWHKAGRHKAPAVQLALQDAQRAMGLVRREAAYLGINPRKIGVIGFSAGGHLVTAISNADHRSYKSVDVADSEPSRPNFAIALYPGHLWSGKKLGLYPWNTISSSAPPTFLLQSADDPVDDINHSLAYAVALRRANVPVEMHFYAEGGHAFGIRPTTLAIGAWPELVEKWLRTINIIDP